MKALRAAALAGAAGLVTMLGPACAAPADASVLLDLAAFSDNGLPALRAPAAVLEIFDEDGEALPAAVRVGDAPGAAPDGTILVQSPLPVPCDDDGRCRVELRLRPGAARFVLHLRAADRCGVEGELMRFASEVIELRPWEPANVELALETVDFDDDGDGLVNVMEHAVCGRTDVGDGAAPPLACLDPADPCCQDTSPLEGRMAAFAGGPHRLADGSVVEVAPFALDATEVTWRQLARCVAAGGCLAGEPEHPARRALAARPDDHEPVQGLLPSEAAELCSFFNKRLPRDAEWDFAAAHRATPGDPTDPGARGRFPWSEDGTPDDVDCRPDVGGRSANHSVPGTPCPGRPLPVGSYPSTWVERGAGAPLADLGGNVAEWTLIEEATAPTIPEVPPGTIAVVLRGGGASSPRALLENDLPVVARLPSPADTSTWSANVRRLAEAAGVRCAVGVDDGTVAPPEPLEPICAAP